MKLEVIGVQEQTKSSGGVEYHTVTVQELSDTPLLQFCDYSLTETERQLKGTLKGKRLTLTVDTIRSVFSGRPQLSGSMTLHEKK